MITPPDPEHRICCPGCGQLLAVQQEGGGLRPVIVGAYVDREGRIVVDCPNCAQRVRLQPHRFRAA